MSYYFSLFVLYKSEWNQKWKGKNINCTNLVSGLVLTSKLPMSCILSSRCHNRVFQWRQKYQDFKLVPFETLIIVFILIKLEPSSKCKNSQNANTLPSITIRAISAIKNAKILLKKMWRTCTRKEGVSGCQGFRTGPNTDFSLTLNNGLRNKTWQPKIIL